MNFLALNKLMVDEQLIPRGINNPDVLSAFQKVPRHEFVPAKYIDTAYEDYPLPIGADQTISQPYMVALMTQSLEISQETTVLEIGTGSGYQTAILAHLAKCVYSVERIASLAEKAEKVLNKLKVTNFKIKVGDGTMGWPEYAPYGGIIVTASAPEIPPPLVEQLGVEGKLVIPVGGSFNQILMQVTKHKNEIASNSICGCVFVPLVGKHGWKE